jgi:ribose transport system substrate-binding protein
MKRKLFKPRFMLLMVTMFLLLLSACSNDSGSQETAAEGQKEDGPKDKYHFIFVPKLIHPWYESVRAGALGAIEEYKEQGIEIELGWDPPPTADIIEHSQKIETAISKQPDAIAVAALDPATTTPVINQAIDNGTKIITFEADAAESNRALYIGNNHNDKDGEVLAEYLAEQMDYKGEVAILLGSLGAPSHKERVEGFKRVIAKYPDMKIVAEQADNDDIVKAASLTESILQANPNVKGIFANNAANPIGAAQAVKSAGKAGDVLIVGMDDDPETIKFLKEGVISATVVQNVPDIGYKAIQHMVNLANGESVPEIDEIDSYIVTTENLADYEKKQEEYAEWFKLLK